MVRKRFETFKDNGYYPKYKSEVCKLLETATDVELEAIENLFPIKLMDYSKINYCELDYFYIMSSASKRLGNIPSISNFFGVLSDEFDVLQLVTIEDVFQIVEMNNKEYKIVAVNPNMNRAAKMLYGDSVGDITYELCDWFVDHLLDEHTNIYKKNSGESYNEAKLTENEINASSDWLDNMFQEEIYMGFKLYLSIQNPAVTELEATKRKLALIKLYDLIHVIEDSKNEMIGYGFTKCEEFEQEVTTLELLKSKLNVNEPSIKMLDELEEKVNVVDTYCYDIMKLAYDNCYVADFERVVASAVIKLVYVLVTEDESIPEYDIIKRYQVTKENLEDIKRRYQEALEVEPITLNDITLKDWEYHYCGDVFIKQIHRREFLVYDNIINKCNSYTKALIRKCKLTSKDILHTLIELKDVDAPLIYKYEASAISLAQQLNLYKNSKVPDRYLNYFREHKNSVKDVIR